MTRSEVLIPKKLSSIKVDHRDSRSTYNSVLQKVVKSVSALFLKDGPAHPEGSPLLVPHRSAEKICHIRKAQVEGIWIYAFAKPGAGAKSINPKHNLYYFAGGGFRAPAFKEHWLLCAEMCLKLPQYVIHLVSYPLGPNNAAPTALPHLQRMYDTLSSEARAQKSTITLMGDSAGANIALVLGMYAASSFLEYPTGEACTLRNIIAISPPTDLRNGNPEIDVLIHKDPILSRKIIDGAANVWHGEWPVSDPRLSPLLADLSVFQRANIKVDGVTAGYDVLTPDAILFRERLAEYEVFGAGCIRRNRCTVSQSCFRIMSTRELLAKTGCWKFWLRMLSFLLCKRCNPYPWVPCNYL
jgi:acetyl esterase/lipase